MDIMNIVHFVNCYFLRGMCGGQILNLKAPFTTIVAFVAIVDQRSGCTFCAACSLICTVHCRETLYKKAAMIS